MLAGLVSEDRGDPERADFRAASGETPDTRAGRGDPHAAQDAPSASVSAPEPCHDPA